MIIGVPKESYPGERRVALVPGAIPALAKKGAEVVIETGAGAQAGFPDAEFKKAKARVLPSRADVFSSSDVIFQVRTVGANPEAGASDYGLLRDGQVLIGFAEPLTSLPQMQELARRKVTAFALELIPRITRAQSMDALSSMATVSGYKAVLLAAGMFGRLFPMMMTAAGTVTPARLLVVGAGVAGLQAIATGRRLGALVQAYDIRPAAKLEVESLGAKFVELPLETADAADSGGYAKAQSAEFYRKQQELLGDAVAKSDVVITTAAVPGKKAPVLIAGEIVARMGPGSVIVDLAAEQGGNCAVTVPGETVERNGVRICGARNLASEVPHTASQLYAKNISAFFLHLFKDGAVQVSPEDEICRETLVTRGGEVVNPRVREALGLPAAPAA
ncbi:MAG: NAD(P) transhydrogenase subunit alpha [Candidatus Tectomicrobia bacterium RIFCSPLOWO2_12_FULL_69_37]|nr:MAG: NAD(P) transhydrogenase subunit alpha [Candidatus Tectomicrobia bacterium RIFCSPLOWO2_02_FULL_70_19]OGL62739.1 MAG: NAD(P) transhydrogenase subunit alpha [Candidatus Tectomicrobia bacterium RIFCSPLOWO2_12_FULL_69_37]